MAAKTRATTPIMTIVVRMSVAVVLSLALAAALADAAAVRLSDADYYPSPYLDVDSYDRLVNKLYGQSFVCLRVCFAPSILCGVAAPYMHTAWLLTSRPIK